MNRKTIVAFACLFLAISTHSVSTVRAAEKPNILFIFADDWGWGDLSCHGHPYVKTPNIDRLAKEGTDFHRFTVASGVCSPSRTAVMTGHFPARYNIDAHFAWVPQNQKQYEWRCRDIESRADAIYASVLSHADDRIGAVLNTLDRLQLTDSTLVIFSSDNGPARASGPTELTLHYDTATGAGWGIGAAKGITGGRKGYKSALFEGGIGVPFIARWPGKIAAGKVDKTSLLSAVDLLPTFCELAGAILPDKYRPDGVSQVATLLGNRTTTRSKPLYWKMQSPWPIPKSRPYHWVSYAIVHENWKLLANRDATYSELYDITADPYEKVDLAEKKPEVVKQLMQQIDDWKASLPESPSGDVFSNERSQPAADR